MPEFSVILVEPIHEGNVGSVARAMKNFGFSKLALVNPPKLDKDARAFAMHARDLMESAKVYPTFADMAKDYDFLVGTSAIVATDKNPLRSPIFPEDLAGAFSVDGKVGIVFGREDHGLSNEEIDECDVLVFIPASEEYPTLNLSHSVAIILYELHRIALKHGKKRFRKFRKADAVEKRVLLEKIDIFAEKVLEKEYEAWLAKRTMRQLLGRAFVSGKEAFTLIGLFRRAMRKMKD
jgi:TrmH family RNA methyltransferase